MQAESVSLGCSVLGFVERNAVGLAFLYILTVIACIVLVVEWRHSRPR